ncbi:transcriptional regulator, TetR family [Micromonospora citrea]|uniref:Transcriptional regulator, TetR family n=1 Tax=Micromonospora citrea TaxID=47855 RepID=A0A1C6UZ08_9ACTN|nr:TetR family transcriptional regulator [Micromonospora citrea]SCL59298.1 transcriptional regulator, TetR family [Micromonospora citrea]
MSRADATRARILQAATAEFAAGGIAGARVDRIAAAAEVNKNLIYVYFHSKGGLFDAVFEAHVTRGLHQVPFTPDDLPGYAGRLFDYYREHPEVVRLATWHRLERGDSGDHDPAVAGDAREAKLDALAGTDGPFRPATLLTLVLAIAGAWTPTSISAIPHTPAAAQDAHECRDAVVEAVRRLIQQFPGP